MFLWGCWGWYFRIELQQGPESYFSTFPYVSGYSMPNFISIWLFMPLISTCTYVHQRHIQKRGFWGPWDQTGPSWGWSLSSWDGPRYRLTGNHSEKKAAENILRAGSGSRTNISYSWWWLWPRSFNQNSTHQRCIEFSQCWRCVVVGAAEFVVFPNGQL